MSTAIEKLELLVRSGQFEEAERRLNEIGKVERKDAAVVANIARRVKRVHLAVKILNPIVRSDNKLQTPPTALEKVEYADCLRQLGAVDEAWEILCEIDPNEFPKAGLHKAFCLITQWRYDEALVILKQEISRENLSPYDRTVAQINLAASLVQMGHWLEAADLLESLRNETRLSGHLLLYGNSLELSAQVAISHGKFDEALKMLQESADVLKQSGRVVSLYAQKWHAIAQSLKIHQTTSELIEVSERARQTKHWEIVRDCDLHRAYLDQDQKRLQRLYIGTPFKNFRDRILHFAGPSFEIPQIYTFSQSEKPKRILDLSSGNVVGKSEQSLATGQALHRFLILISQDFYQPLSVMSAFGKLFPGEFMNLETSANRVYQIVRRCRAWFEESNWPVTIEESDGTYRLQVSGDVGFAIPSDPLPLLQDELKWNALKTKVGENPFHVRDVCDYFSCSASSAKVLLNWGFDQGRIERSGQARNTCYRIVSKKVA